MIRHTLTPNSRTEPLNQFFNGQLPARCKALANLHLDHKSEAVLLQTREFGPSCVKELNIRLKLEQAEHICEILRLEASLKGRELYRIHPYDFASTQGVWKFQENPNTDYAMIAFEELFNTLASEEKTKATTLDGFKTILPHLTQETFRKHAINNWETKLSGLFSSRYENNTSLPVLELIERCPRFKAINKVGFKAYDLNQAPNGTWVNEDESLTQTSLDVTKLLILKVAGKLKCSFKSVSGFARILKHLTVPTFEKMPINIWGTTLSGMLQVVSKQSPSTPVLALVQSDSDFCAIKKAGLDVNDFAKSPNGTWKKGSVSKALARKQIHQLIVRLAENLDTNPYSVSGFKKILPLLTETTIQKTAINRWGITCSSPLAIIYENSPSTAVLDLIKHDPKFSKIKAAGISAWDFPNCPNNYWLTSTGKPTRNSKLIIGIAYKLFNENPIKTDSTKKLPRIKDLTSIKINVWGTSCKSALEKAYKENLTKALKECRKF